MELTDENVGAYLGLTPEAVRVLRLYRDIHQCRACQDVHPSFPHVRVFHSPICKAQHKCRICNGELGNIGFGHDVGLICQACHDGPAEVAFGVT